MFLIHSWLNPRRWNLYIGLGKAAVSEVELKAGSVAHSNCLTNVFKVLGLIPNTERKRKKIEKVGLNACVFRLRVVF